MTPEDHYDEAMIAINNEQWDKATAHATTGLLSMTIGTVRGFLDAVNKS